MDLDAPFTGTLLLPDKLLPHGESPVELPDGQLVAQIRWNLLAWGTFTILDPQGREVAGAKGSGMFMSRTFGVARPDGRMLLELSLGWRGTSGRSTVTQPDGAQLTVKGSSFRRRFSILDPAGTEVATITPTSSSFSLRKDAYAFELRQPVLSIVQAVSLAQCLREAVKSARSTSSSRSSARSRASSRARRR